MLKNNKISPKNCLGLYDKESTIFLDERKLTKMQWLLDPDQSDADNMKTVGLEASRHFKKKEEIYERRS
jgi:hypothetical protein